MTSGATFVLAFGLSWLVLEVAGFFTFRKSLWGTPPEYHAFALVLSALIGVGLAFV